ncbi:uncharacterized protein LOC118183217 isoform X2 [Stegodyphus dumicola]|uniref:uncharacterized protein LOC118183217 isoform X2 n=1 Tax=Stegodyphus dumicola TaxID=202533 RepID=UPI0015A89E1F|nr:uncharacterized protein LOC118183217 isoform X2 [Stegodyphus dumicola]
MHQPRIYAGAPAGVHVTTVHAYDPDRPRKKVEYNLPNALDYKYFVIDNTSGNLTTARPIDKAVGETYQVMVAAVSYGLSEIEHIQIAVTEFNQFAPRFERRNYTIELHPTASLNSQVLTVKATDPDPAPHNAEIYYRMDQNSTSKYFSLDSLTGKLYLIQSINETTPSIHFGIFAEDGGSPKRWDYVPVNVVLKSISAPLNVTVSNITFSSAVVCWSAPEYGLASDYVLIHNPKGITNQSVFNVTSNHETSVCEILTNLTGDTDYELQIYAWNSENTGQKTDIYTFHTEENWCHRNVCNTGMCIPLYHEPRYECECSEGFYGSKCEYFNPCSQSPCRNSGKCLNTTHNEYVCVCADDYSGPNCGSYNPCLRKNPCQNGGTCEMTTNNTYICICAEGYYGRKCKYRDLCLPSPCLNGGTCEHTSDTTLNCICPTGFTGSLCGEEVDECASNPCSTGSTCTSHKGNFTCICPSGFSGQKCDIAAQCPPDRTDTEKGLFYWNATKHSSKAIVKCPFGALDSTMEDKIAYRFCFLNNGSAVWGPVNASQCKGKGFVFADELAEELHNLTQDSSAINLETLEAAAQGIETIANYAKQDKKIAQGMVQIISNVMDAEELIEKDEDGTFSQNMLDIVDDFASNVELKPGESLSVASENLLIQSVEWHPEIAETLSVEEYDDHLQFEAPADKGILEIEEKDQTQDNESTSASKTTTVLPSSKPKVPMMQVFVPKEALQEAHRQLERSVRVKFVVYYNDNLFQSKLSSRTETSSKSKTEVPESRGSKDGTSTSDNYELKIRAPVLQISVGNVSLKNLGKPLIYILPIVTKRTPSCVYWNERERLWSADGLKTNHTTDKVICESSHMTAFSVLLDLTPQADKDEMHEVILSIISYAGSVLSIIGLSLTIITYLLFGCLNRDHPGKILLNLCFSLLMMNAIFLTGAAEPANGGNACAAVGLFLHYFVLTSLTWMCVEAINMYQLLVHVFASSETHFLLKRCFFAWGGPLIIVALTASFGLDSYYDDLEFCMLSPRNPWIYYCAFLAPSCILLAVNFTVFILVSRVIFTPRLTTKTSNNHQVVTAAQVRGAFTVMVLLGVTWVFGTMAFGHVKIIFQYFFCISNSLQGFLIFLVRCLLYPEARNAWFYLLKTGKLKKHRGIMPPGTVSFSTNSQGGKNPVSTINTAARNDSNEDYGKERKQENHKSSRDTSSLRRHKNYEASYQNDRNARIQGWKKQESKLHRNSKKNAKNNNQMWNQQDGEICVKGQCESPGIWSVHGKEIFRNGQIGSHINVRPPHFDKQLFKAPFQNEQFGSNVRNLCNAKISRFSPDNGDKLEHLDLPEKESMDKSDFCKDRRSLSLDVPCGLNGSRNTVSINSTYPTIEGFKYFLSNMQIHSPDGIGKDKRSLSLDTGTPKSIPRTEVGREMQNNIKKEKFGIDIGFNHRNSIVLEQEEDAHSDENSASTDVEDSPPASLTKSSHSSHASFGLQSENRAGPKSCRKNSQCFRQDLEEGSSLQHTSSTSPKKSYVDIVK